MAVKIVKAKAGDSLCSIALRHGLDSCDRLRSENPTAAKKSLLEEGTFITVPLPVEGTEAAVTHARKVLRLLTDRAPRVEFIRDEGRGDADPEDCDRDPVRTNMAISNYVVDRAGDGLTAGNFPGPTAFSHNPGGVDASADIDHFKVQVFDPHVPAATSTVKVLVSALKPEYFGRIVTFGGQWFAEIHQDEKARTRPDNANRFLLAECKRVGSSAFFRSAYLRLVSSEADRLHRPSQTVLVSDYFDEGTEKFRKFHTEIQDQAIEALYELPVCKHGKCATNKIVPMENNGRIRMAFHIVRDKKRSDAKKMHDGVRELVYKWTRRVLAAAGVSPHLTRIGTVSPPKNVLFVADSNVVNVGMPTAGKDFSGGPSEMTFKVAGHQFKFAPAVGRTPRQTAATIRSLVLAEPKFKHLKIEIKELSNLPLPAPTPGVPVATAPCDLVFLDRSRRPVKVSDATSTDFQQELESIGGDKWWQNSAGRFPVSDDIRGASKQERALRWNHDVPGSVNCYVVPQREISGAINPTLDLVGATKPGDVGTFLTTIGPAVFLARDALKRQADGTPAHPTSIVHELGHLLIHCQHATAPTKDAGSGSCELMNVANDANDAHDMTKHLSDAPIAAQYDVFGPNGSASSELLSGPGAGGRLIPFLGSADPDTPVHRLRFFANHYGVLHRKKHIIKDTTVKDLPIRDEAVHVPERQSA